MTAMPQVFGALAIAGGLYLAWLGLKSLRVAFDANTMGMTMGGAKAASKPFVDGFVVQMTNPKALLFFTAVLPPFIDLDRAMIPQLAMFGAGLLILDIIQMSAYAIMGAVLARKFSQARFARIFSAGVGIILIVTSALVLLRATA